MNFQFAQAAMHEGDIILTTDPHSVVSTFIRRATGSQYSHAAIYVGGRLIEARGMGVASVSLDRLRINDVRCVVVLRHRDREGAQRAARRAHEFLGHRYHYLGALLSAVRRRPLSLVPATFCSALVGEAYQKAGIDLFNGVDPRMASPGDFLRSRHLEDVTESVIMDLPVVDVTCRSPIEVGAGNKYSKRRLGARHRTFSVPLQIALRALGQDIKSVEEAVLSINRSSGWRRNVADRLLSRAILTGGLADAWGSSLRDVQEVIDGLDLSGLIASIGLTGGSMLGGEEADLDELLVLLDAQAHQIHRHRDQTARFVNEVESRMAFVASLYAQGDSSIRCLPSLRSVLIAQRAEGGRLLSKLGGLLGDLELVRERSAARRRS